VAKTAGAARVYRRGDVELALRIKRLLLVDGLTLAGVRRRLEEEMLPAVADASALDGLIGRNARERLNEIKKGLRWILDLLGEGSGVADFRLTAPAPRSRTPEPRPPEVHRLKPRGKPGPPRSAASRRRKH
jgi:hypothetical protein